MTSLQTEAESKIQPIAGNVFLKRRTNRESELYGLHISQGASVGSCDAEIVAIDGKCPCATAGDIVHVPHYGVIDMEYDGVDYATCKADRLFVAKRGGKWVPINGYVKVRKCENDHIRDESGDIALYMTDNHIETTNWVEIVDIADDCGLIREEHIGLFAPIPESDDRIARIERSKDFGIGEELFDIVTNGEGMIKPIGDTVVLSVYSDGIDDFGVKTDGIIYTVESSGSTSDMETGALVIVHNDDMQKISTDGCDYFYTKDDNVCIVVIKT